MKFQAKFGPTLEQIHHALAEGFDGLKLSNGKILTASTTNNTSPSGGRFPFMALRTGSGTFSPWKDFEWSISWNIPATVTVQGPGEDGEVSARSILNDLMVRTMKLTGLPLNAKGHVVALDETTIKLFDDGKLTFLCERGAPYISSFDIRATDDGLCTVELMFHIEAVLSFDQRTLNRMKVGVVGVRAVPPNGLYQDPYGDEGRGIARVFSAGDQVAFTGYDTSDPHLKNPGDFYNSNQEKPVSKVPFVEGIVAVILTPYTASLSTGVPTVQLKAIGQHQDYATIYVTGQAQWHSTDITVATVSASGLVTRVAAGNCLISATYNGVDSNSVAVSCT